MKCWGSLKVWHIQTKSTLKSPSARFFMDFGSTPIYTVSPRWGFGLCEISRCYTPVGSLSHSLEDLYRGRYSLP